MHFPPFSPYSLGVSHAYEHRYDESNVCCYDHIVVAVASSLYIVAVLALYLTLVYIVEVIMSILAHILWASAMLQCVYSTHMIVMMMMIIMVDG